MRGNYCTGNPTDKDSNFTFSNGNLQTTSSSGNTQGRCSIGVVSGKWYFELTGISATSSGGSGVGVERSDVLVGNTSTSNVTYYYHTSGNKYDASTSSAYGSTWTDNDVIGVALDLDNGAIYFSKNGTWQNSGVPTSGSSKTGAAFTVGFSGYTWMPLIRHGVSATCALNFGQRPFAYTAPSGFKALCTQNLSTPTIGATSTTQAGKYMNIVLYTGTGSSQSITGVGFQPDWVWIKGRSGATDHGLYDAVRGVQKQIESNNTDAETTETTGLTAFGSDGFTVGALAQLNTSSATYVGWNWNAGGSNATNTSGTITSTVRANTTTGFSIVTYTGTGTVGTIGHGLGVKPSFIIFKVRSNGTYGWYCYHTSINATNHLVLNTTAGSSSSSFLFNDTEPTSTVMTVGTSVGTNQSSQTFVAYCFAAVAGYSAFGSYTANGSTDGPFVYTGFRPRFIMTKKTNSTSSWAMIDTSQNPYNQATSYLLANSSSASVGGTSANGLDALSNGFKLRSIDNSLNETNGDTYIYAAFAESPFKYSLAR